jgi:hypothetical protein
VSLQDLFFPNSSPTISFSAAGMLPFAPPAHRPACLDIPITKSRVINLLAQINEINGVDVDGILTNLRGLLNETLTALEKKRVIGLVGRLAIGKSSALNAILGVELLPTSDGSTTAVPTEIQRIDGDRYFLEVHYLAEDETRRLFETLINPNTPDEVREIVRRRLESLFSIPDPLAGSAPLIPSNFVTPVGVIADGVVPLVDLIGRPCRVVEAHDLNHLRELIQRETDYTPFNPELEEQPVNHLKHALKKLVIKGPFVNLPKDVILVDTPGLNDDDGTNSRRTLDLLETFDEMWFFTELRQQMKDAVDNGVFRNFYGARGSNIRIIPTGGPSSVDRNRLYSAVVQKMWRGVSQDDAVAEIPIDFWPNEEDLGAVQSWHARLQQIHADHEANVANYFHQAYLQLSGLGGTVNIPPNWEADFINQIRDLSPTRGKLVPRFRETNKITIRVLMTPDRSGVFESKHTGFHNINDDLAIVWLNWCQSFLPRLSAAITHQLTTLALSLGPEYSDYLNTHSFSLLGALTTICQRYFANNSELIRNEFLRKGVYCWDPNRIRSYGRNYLPTEDEFKSAIKRVLLPRANEGMQCLVDLIPDVLRMLPPSPTEQIRQRLQSLFDFAGPYPGGAPWYQQLWTDVWTANPAPI